MNETLDGEADTRTSRSASRADERPAGTLPTTLPDEPEANPFPGLRPFREDEQHLFFGRETRIDTMVDKLAATRFLAVVGSSGCGKSSLVNCGLQVALRAGLMSGAGTAWRIARMRPGGEPVAALARALSADGTLFRDFQPDGLALEDIVETNLRMSRLGLVDVRAQARLPEGTNLLVVVDQFEELFRYRSTEQDGEESASAFVALLLEAARREDHPVHVVLTMRSDFLGDCARLPGLAEAINAGQYLVPRMSREERRQAIAGPVAVAGADIEPVLMTRLLNDLGDDPDRLPILQHALNRLWAAWRAEGGGGPLSLAHYGAVGSMANALDRHLEQAFGELPDERARTIAARLFRALTDKSTDPRGIRRPTAFATLCTLCEAEPAELAAIIDVFRAPGRSFLMPPAGEPLHPGAIVDISHESLMRKWRRLHAWAEEEALSRRTYRRLADTATLHERGEAGLWRDPDLELALAWRRRDAPNAAWASRYGAGFERAMSFLEMSGEAREAERERRREESDRAVELARTRAVAGEQAARIAAQEKAAKVQRTVTWVIAGAFALALVPTALAWWQTRSLDAAERSLDDTRKVVRDYAGLFAGELTSSSVDDMNIELLNQVIRDKSLKSGQLWELLERRGPPMGETPITVEFVNPRGLDVRLSRWDADDRETLLSVVEANGRAELEMHDNDIWTARVVATGRLVGTGALDGGGTVRIPE